MRGTCTHRSTGRRLVAGLILGVLAVGPAAVLTAGAGAGVARAAEPAGPAGAPGPSNVGEDVGAPPAPPPAGDVPVIDLFTMGPGPDLFARFGHAALCVTDTRHPRGVCYNYGTTRFEHAADLIWGFLRGRARFWVSRSSLPDMVDMYVADDRTLYRQRLPLSPEQARSLAAALTADLHPSRRTYVYHHFKENCATRLRDHLDRATGGRLGRGADARVGGSFRDASRRGFAGTPALLVATELILGRAGDERMSVWQAMFLPDVLRAEVAGRLGAPPEVLYVREAALPAGSPTAGRAVLAGVALGLAAVVAVGWALGRAGVVRVVVAVALGLVGLVFWGLAAASTLSELRENELLLVFLPVDLILPFLRGRSLVRYLAARIVLVAAVAIGAAVGLLVQPIAAPLAIAAAPLAILLAHALGIAGRLGGPPLERALLRHEGGGPDTDERPRSAPPTA